MAEAMNTGPREWDAETYDAVSNPQFAWGMEVLERLELRGDEAAVDAGCGSGRVTEQLLARLPDGRMTAVDGSEAMIAKAKERLGERATYVVSDLSELALPEPVDLIFSTATFHWIVDHDRLFARLRENLVPGGRLVAQCGGAGNISALKAAAERVGEREPYAPALAGWPGPWNFATTEDTARRLREAGWVDVLTWYQQVRVEPDDPHEYLGTVALGEHLERLDEHLRARFVDEVLERLDEPVVDYVRLNILARRPS
jgi:trans-aconitate 2-methyltransferase